MHMIQGNPTGRDNRRWLPGRLIEDAVLLFRLTIDFSRGKYRRLPARLIVVLALALVYICLPFDIIPDYIPGYGQIDDVLVAFFCLYLLEKDLYAYKDWKNKQHGEFE